MTEEETRVAQEPTRSSAVLSWFRGHLAQIRLLAVGFVIGALVVGLRSCGGEASETPGAEVHAEHESATGEAIWTCSMHPQIRKNEPGSCPICGMDLIPVSSNSNDAQDEHPTQITLSKRAQKLAQLRTTEVHRRSDASGAVRLLGRIEPNETSLKTITAWTGGRIDRLYVNTTGEKVKGGQVIATLYSPEVFAAHQDLITASNQVEKMADGAESSRRAAEAALRAARQRLSLLGVPDGELARMEKQEKPTTAVSIRTPFGGTVMERIATEGTYIATGAPLYKIANLSTLWIQLDAYESDLPLLSVDQEVEIQVDAYPGEEFKGRITFIDPSLDPVKRTAKVRVEIENDEGRLRPGMFAEAVVASAALAGAEAPLVIPSSAPLFTGRRAIVYVEISTDKGFTYEARTVRLGPRLGNVYPVVAGLSEGERIVTRGAFALDADLQIRGGDSMMYSPDDQQSGMWDEIVHVERSKLSAIASPLEAYLEVQEALADDDLPKSQEAARKVSRALVEANFEANSEANRAWGSFSKMLGEHAEFLAKSDSLEEARRSFEKMSGAVVMVLRVLGNPLEKPIFEAHCPMARGSQGGNWIQEGDTVENPYFGASMLTCGDVTGTVAPGQHLAGPERKSRKESSSKPTGGHDH